MSSLEKRLTVKHISAEDFYKDVEWKNIKMLSVLIGKNGIGKSTVLKMINYYFTKDSKLSYKIKTNDS